MEKLLISACLLGVNCKYSGGNNALPPETLRELSSAYDLLPVCPETAGGLPTPRTPSERRGDRVVDRMGEDVSAAFEKGAEQALSLARRKGCRKALLKENSPSCGKNSIYDGSFSGRLVPGQGLAAEKLSAQGIELFCEGELDELFMPATSLSTDDINGQDKP